VELVLKEMMATVQRKEPELFGSDMLSRRLTTAPPLAGKMRTAKII